MVPNRVSSLTGVLKNVEPFLSERDMAGWQEEQLKKLLVECHNVVTDVGILVNENYYLEPSNVHGMRGKAQRTWKRLTLEPKEIQELRSRMNWNVTCLNAFTQTLTRYCLRFLNFNTYHYTYLV